MANVPEPIKKY